jgi:poly-gamma-glutamate capsule biosynthesis protein CapA/YwtB (metallophosphatase superfamily)
MLLLTALSWAGEPELGSTEPAAQTQPAAPTVITFAAAGDTMMGTDTRKGPRGLASGNGEGLFTGVGEWMKAADVAFLNLEGPMGDDIPVTKCGPKSSNCYAFLTPTRYVAALTGMGIDMVSLANNHGWDAGRPGMAQSMATLDAAGIGHSGLPGDVAIIERKGLKIGMVAAATSGCCLNINKLDEITEAIRDLDSKVDIVVLSFHGGAEGSKHRHVPGKLEIAWGEKRGDVKALARAAVDAGADLVLGHGPHVLRGMEVYKDRLVVYSMGNFCGYNQFGTRGGYGGTSVVVEATLAASGKLSSARLRAVALDGLARPRPDAKGRAWTQVHDLSASDFPDTGVRVGPQGELSWGAVTP